MLCTRAFTYSAATRGPVAKPPRSTRVTTALGDTSRSSLRYAACLPSSEGWFSAACLSRLSFLLRRLSPKGHTKSRTWRARDWRYGPLEVTATVPSPEGSATGTASFASPAPSTAPRPPSWSSSRPSPPSAEGPASSDPAALHDSDSRVPPARRPDPRFLRSLFSAHHAILKKKKGNRFQKPKVNFAVFL